MLRRNRRLNRKPNWNYKQNGIYFITIITKDRKNWFGEIKNKKMYLNNIGLITDQCWNQIPLHFTHINLGKYIIMPNHVHGILKIDWDIKNYWDENLKYVGNNDLGGSSIGVNDLGGSSAVRGFKIGVTKYAKYEIYHYNFGWQKSYYDRIIKSENDHKNTIKYIQNNPKNWKDDNLF